MKKIGFFVLVVLVVPVLKSVDVVFLPCRNVYSFIFLLQGQFHVVVTLDFQQLLKFHCPCCPC